MNKKITAIFLSIILGISTAACAAGGEESTDSAAAPAGSEGEYQGTAFDKNSRSSSKEDQGAAGKLQESSDETGSSNEGESNQESAEFDTELMQAMKEAFIGAVFSEASADGLSKEDFDLAQETMNQIAESAANGDDISEKDMETLEELIEKNKDNKLVSSYYSAASAIDLINEYMNADEEKRAEMNSFLDELMEYALASDAESGGAYSAYVRRHIQKQIGEQNFKNLCVFYTGFRQTYSSLGDNGKKMTRAFVKGTVERCNEELTDEEWESVNNSFESVTGISVPADRKGSKNDSDTTGKDDALSGITDPDMKLTPETVDLLFDLMDSGKLDPILLNEENEE